MSADLPIHQMRTEQANELASYASFFQDLTFAADAFKKLLDEYDHLSQLDARSLWSAALVSYARCFAHGRRIQLTSSIYDSLEGEAKECHEYLIGMRNKHIAHSVNPFEEIGVGAAIKDDSIVAIATVIVSHLFPDKDGVENLYRLTCVARKYVNDRCKMLEDECLQSAIQMNVDLLRKENVLGYRAPGPEDASLSRPKPT